MFVRTLAFPMESMKSPVCSIVLRMNEDAPPGSDRLLGRLLTTALTAGRWYRLATPPSPHRKAEIGIGAAPHVSAQRIGNSPRPADIWWAAALPTSEHDERHDRIRRVEAEPAPVP